MGAKGARPLAPHWRLKGFATRITVGTLVAFGLLTVSAILIGEKSDPHLQQDLRYGGSTSAVHSFISRTLSALGSRNHLKDQLENLVFSAKEQLAIANSYASFARRAKLDMMREVRLFSGDARNYSQLLERKDIQESLDNEDVDEALLKSVEEELGVLMENSKQLREEAKSFFDNQVKTQKLKDTITQLTDQLNKAKKQGAFNSLIAAKSVPKSIHCLAMKLMSEHIEHPELYQQPEFKPEWEDPTLYHYALFSDNVLAASVVVNSAVSNAKNPSKHVFHLVTDRMNLGAMVVWFTMQPPMGGASIEVKAVEDYKFLNSSYVPVLKQLEMANLQQFYFDNKMENATRDSASLKFRNPKYLSMLNHLRFYLPDMYPKLHKILFLDDDIVVQKDLTALWKVDMKGNVNGAVETCFGSFHRFDKYMNFSHPLVKERFEPKACGWAYGMNFFDLDAWREKKCTEEYHFWQTQNFNRQLWKLGTLPPGLMTFYKSTQPLDKSWHVLGLGYNPSIDQEKIRNAAVIHFNGNMKPWLDLAMNQYREYWTKYVDYEMEYVQTCNFGH